MTFTNLREEQLEDLTAGKITSGTFADARISSSSVTQHEGDINIDNLTNAPTGSVVGTTDTQTLTNKTIDANNNTISNLAVGDEVSDDISYSTAQNTTSNAGNLGATHTFNFNTNSFYRGTLDSDVTITVSNLSDGQRGQITLYYDTTAQRTITWSGVDVWMGGSEPSAPDTANQPLVVTLINDGNLVIASGGIAS